MSRDELMDRLHLYTDAELRYVLQEREAKRKLEIRNKAEAYAERITRELLHQPTSLAILAPEHGRTSCSDSSVVNGFSDDRIPRCTRCALLQVVQADLEWPVGFVLTVSIDQVKLE
jgi:hypothetical protein